MTIGLEWNKSIKEHLNTFLRVRNQDFKVYLALLDAILHNMWNKKWRWYCHIIKHSCVETKGLGGRKLKLKDLRVEKLHYINDVPGACSNSVWGETGWLGASLTWGLFRTLFPAVTQQLSIEGDVGDISIRVFSKTHELSDSVVYGCSLGLFGRYQVVYQGLYINPKDSEKHHWALRVPEWCWRQEETCD